MATILIFSLFSLSHFFHFLIFLICLTLTSLLRNYDSDAVSLRYNTDTTLIQL